MSYSCRDLCLPLLERRSPSAREIAASFGTRVETVEAFYSQMGRAGLVALVDGKDRVWERLTPLSRGVDGLVEAAKRAGIDVDRPVLTRRRRALARHPARSGTRRWGRARWTTPTSARWAVSRRGATASLRRGARARSPMRAPSGRSPGRRWRGSDRRRSRPPTPRGCRTDRARRTGSFRIACFPQEAVRPGRRCRPSSRPSCRPTDRRSAARRPRARRAGRRRGPRAPTRPRWAGASGWRGRSHRPRRTRRSSSAGRDRRGRRCTPVIPRKAPCRRRAPRRRGSRPR
jgi:hypothetical protein